MQKSIFLKRCLITALLSVSYLFVTGQEREATFDDGTILYYTLIDTTVVQMHHIRFNFLTTNTFAYFNPAKRYLIEAFGLESNTMIGADGYYFLASSKRAKLVKAQAKEIATGFTSTAGGGSVATGISYRIPMMFEKVHYYSLHIQASNAFNINTFAVAPEISVGGAIVTAWGIKYMIRDKEMKNSKRALATYRAENLHCFGIDLMYYPVKPSNYGENGYTAYNTVGERLYYKGWLPFWSHRDMSISYLLGIQNDAWGIIPILGIGFGGGF